MKTGGGAGRRFFAAPGCSIGGGGTPPVTAPLERLETLAWLGGDGSGRRAGCRVSAPAARPARRRSGTGE